MIKENRWQGHQIIEIITSSNHKLRVLQSHNPTSDLPERRKQDSIKQMDLFMET
jgi:hypothetical protein